MKDRLKEIFTNLSRRLDLVATGVLLFLLIITGYLYLRETNYVVESPPPPPPKTWNVKVPMDPVIETDEDDPPGNKEEFEEVSEFFLNANPEIEEDPQARKVIVVNMFDIKTVEEEERLREELNQRYNRAEQLFENEQYQDAREIVNEILEQDPNHRASRDLRSRLNALLTPTPTPEAPGEEGA